MSRRSRVIRRYAVDFSYCAVLLGAAVWFLSMSLSTMWSQHKTERWMEDTSAGLRNLNDKVALLCGVISYEGRCLRASWLPKGDKGRTVTYSSGHIPLRDSGVPAPFFRYTNKFDFGRVGDEVAGGESLTVTAPEN